MITKCEICTLDGDELTGSTDENIHTVNIEMHNDVVRIELQSVIDDDSRVTNISKQDANELAHQLLHYYDTIK